MTSAREIESLLQSQLNEWPSAAANYAALTEVKVKDLDFGGMRFRVQFNPARAVSSGAKVDAASIKARKCFLCSDNRPECQQGMEWGGRYVILVNPFPIFPRHFTVPCTDHVPQSCRGAVADMLRLASELEGYTVFYNGPRCGASAPDHFHFQAGNSDFLPLAANLEKADISILKNCAEASLGIVDSLPVKMFVIDAITPEAGEQMFDLLSESLPVADGDSEPMLNMLAYSTGRATRLVVVPRKRHRPSFYGIEGDSCMMLSPAAVDMGGVFVTPRLVDFERFDTDTMSRTLGEICPGTDEIAEVVVKLQNRN